MSRTLPKELLFSAFQVTLTPDMSLLKMICCQRFFVLPLQGFST